MALHVIIGEDDYLVAEAAKKIIGDGTGLETIDSVNAANEESRLKDIRSAEESYFTPPFLFPRKVTWWKNVKFLPGGTRGGGEETEKVSEAVKEALERLVGRFAASPLPEGQEFVLTAPKLLSTSIVAKQLKSAGEMLVLATPKPWQQAEAAVGRVRELAAEAGFRFAAGAAEALVAAVGTDTRSLVSEVAKLSAYLGPGAKEATADDVAEISSEGVGVEAMMWDLTDAVAARDLKSAFRTLARFRLEKGFAVRVTNAVEKLFRTLCELKDAAGKSGLSEAVAEGLAPFTVRKYQGFLAKWSLYELRVARARFLRLRERAVSSSDGVDALVELAILETVGKPRI